MSLELTCYVSICLTGVTLAEKWTTDNVLTTQITVEDQVYSNFFLLIPSKKNCPEQLLKIAISVM